MDSKGSAPRVAALLSITMLTAPAWARQAGTGPTSPSAHVLVAEPASDEVLEADAIAFRLNDTTLAHPFFEGRCPGTRGNQLAADLLEFHYKGLGLLPAFPSSSTPGDVVPPVPNASFRQTFKLGANSRVVASAASWKGRAGDPVLLKPGQDFNVLPFASSGDVTGPLVFAGYGINAGGDGYTSFEDDTDFSGKVALLLRYEPMNEQGRARSGAERWSYLAQLDAKVAAVAIRKAAAIIIVTPPGLDTAWADEQNKGRNATPVAQLETFDSLQTVTGPSKVPVVMVSTEAADRLVHSADPKGRSLLDLRRLVDERGGPIDLPNATVTIKTDVERTPVMTSNVGAILKGRGALADEYVVLGAHYDHIGYGAFGTMPENKGKLHPGADDNASGTSGLMILAQKLVQRYATEPADRPMRSILFLSFTGEESGLNGSKHYTEHMIAPKEKHYLMINFDMIGYLRTKPPLEVSGVGTGEGLKVLVDPILESSGVKTFSNPGGNGPSDHMSFNMAEIPVLFFFTGFHEQYHKPTDTPDLIDPDGAAKVIDLGYRITLAAATRSERMPYTAVEESRRRAVTGAPDPHKAASKDSPGTVKVTVKFGIMPGNYGEENGGVLVGGITPGGWSAEKAGIKKGDRIIKWNGEIIPDVQGWMPFLEKAKPGEIVKVTVVRDGKEMDIDVTLVANDTGAK